MVLMRKYWVSMVAVTLVVACAVFASFGWAQFSGQINALGVDLAHPQAYVSTPALSKLPRDLIKAPVVRDVLTEDFAFYYEEHEDRLGLTGALKRIAFEHDTTLGDKLMETALDQPAEIAWWTDGKGAPRYWLMAMTRSVLARALQGAASLAANDRQLSVIASIRVHGADAKVYALTISPRRTLALVSLGERVVVLSDPGLLFNATRHPDTVSRDVIADLLSDDPKTQARYRHHFGLSDVVDGHSMVADARLMSFGYQYFFPGFKAIRFDLAVGGASLRSKVRVSKATDLPSTPADRALWTALPVNPAACVLVPPDWTRVSETLGNIPRQSMSDANKAAWKKFAEQLEGPAAICWYARSQLQTPLFVARMKAAVTDPNAALEALSEWLFPAESISLEPAAHHGATLWQREVTAPWGPHGDGDNTTYKPTLARQGSWIVFSPDDGLVELALDAQAKRYPSIADTLPPGAATLAVLAPKQMADLAQQEVFLVLPPEQELFRQAAERHLVPRLNALRKLPAARATIAGAPDTNGWVSMDWQTVTSTAKTESGQVRR